MLPPQRNKALIRGGGIGGGSLDPHDYNWYVPTLY